LGLGLELGLEIELDLELELELEVESGRMLLLIFKMCWGTSGRVEMV